MARIAGGRGQEMREARFRRTAHTVAAMHAHAPKSRGANHPIVATETMDATAKARAANSQPWRATRFRVFSVMHP